MFLAVKNTHITLEHGPSHALPETMRNYGACNLGPSIARDPSCTTAGFWRTPGAHVGDQSNVKHP